MTPSSPPRCTRQPRSSDGTAGCRGQGAARGCSDTPATTVDVRAILPSVSAHLGPASDQLVLEGNGVSYFVPKSEPDLGYLAVPVTVYLDAESTPTARIFAPNTAQHTSLIVTLVGYLVRQP